MVRKLLLALVVVGTTVLASQPPEASAAQPPLCDKYCPTGDDSDLCTCPDWTDQRVEVATCGTWYTYYGCWYF